MSYDVLIDLRAIQDYIFSSNKLRDNLGASYLVSHIFDDFKDEEKGFCGGGNLYLHCDSETQAKEIVKNLSRAIFETAPGLSFNAVIEETRKKRTFLHEWKDYIKNCKKKNKLISKSLHCVPME